MCNGLVLASDGKKMSKRLKNYPVGPLGLQAASQGPVCTQATRGTPVRLLASARLSLPVFR